MKNIALTLGWIAVLQNMFRLSLILVVISSIFVPFPLITALILLIPFIILTWLIPLSLGTQQRSFRSLFYRFGGTILFSIAAFAYIYFKHGLIASGKHQDIGFEDALYFSITTWTTLGFGDFAPTPECRLVTSVEALVGYFSMAVFIIIAGLFVTEGTKIVECWFGNNTKN